MTVKVVAAGIVTEPTHTTNTMTPIAFLAFVFGMNATAPKAPPLATEQKPKVEKPQPQPAKDAGAAKRGGWDGN